MATVWVVTGGIGSGKSTIAGVLDDLGARVIDADAIGHHVLEPGGPAHDAVAARWPHVVRDGRIDRSALGSVVFTDPDQLRELEAMTHPGIASEVGRRVAGADEPVVIVEISVPRDLIGAGWLRTIVADLPEETRIERLMGRGMDRADIDRRMANQPTRDEWRARGRWIVSTEGTREEVEARVRGLWSDIISRGR